MLSTSSRSLLIAAGRPSDTFSRPPAKPMALRANPCLVVSSSGIIRKTSRAYPTWHPTRGPLCILSFYSVWRTAVHFLYPIGLRRAKCVQVGVPVGIIVLIFLLDGYTTDVPTLGTGNNCRLDAVSSCRVKVCPACEAFSGKISDVRTAAIRIERCTIPALLTEGDAVKPFMGS